MITTSILLLGSLLGPNLQDSHADFRSSFQRAMEIKSTKTMAQLVKRNQEEAVSWILQTAEGISVGSSEELATRMSALRNAWKTSMETDFASKMEEYFSLLEPTLLRERAKLKSKYRKLKDAYWDNQEAKDGPTFDSVGAQFAVLADNFAKIGDHYFSSQCWGFYGICYGAASLGDKADLYKACRGSGLCVSERLLIELNDLFCRSNRQTHDHLMANGYGEESPSDGEGAGAGPAKGGSGGAGKEPKATGKELIAPLSFESVEEVDDFLRPSYFADELYVMWSTVNLGKKGGGSKISNLGDLSPTVLRSASSEITIDLDGDGQGDEIVLDGKTVDDGKVALTGNMRLVQFKIGEGTEQREWACYFATGLEKDLFQGFERGMGIYDESVQLFHFNAGSLVGEVAGEKLQVFDDNSDGLFGSPPVPWEYSGLSEGNRQQEMDSVRVGDSKRARPWSEYQQVGEAWFRMAISPSGAELVATPVTLQTGKLKLKYSGRGGKPTWVVVRGKGKYEGSYFDLLANGSKGVEVPVGSYELFSGEVRKGKGRQTAKALMVPGAGMGGWEASEGKTSTVELGGPFSYDFGFEASERLVKVLGETVVVTGAAGERYERPWNCRLTPDVLWREAGKKKGNKAERMKLINDQFVMLDVERSYQKVWFPLDCEFEVKTDVVEVQLQEKKNALFGKLESSWKE